MTAVIGAGPPLRQADGMTPSAATSSAVLERPVESLSAAQPGAQARLRVRPIMKQGTASSIPEAWVRFTSVDDARAAIKRMYHDDRVQRAFIVTDDLPPHFVEWVER